MVNFSQVLFQTYLQSPEQTAITLLHSQEPEQVLTYRSLLQGAGGTARLLDQAGVQPGEVVVLILNHGVDLVYAFYGAILHGAIPAIMPFLTEKLSPEQYRESLAALFEITKPKAVLTYPEFLREARLALEASPAACRPILLVSSAITLLEEADLAPKEQWQGLSRAPEDVVLLQHSSGTTGLQKGVALSHQAVFNQLESYAAALQLNPQDVIVSWLPLYHDMGLIAGFILPVLQRIHLVLLSPFDWVRAPYKLLQAVSRYRGTLTWLPNFAYNFCTQKIRARDLEGVELSSWRAVINCSEPMHWKSHALFQERFQPYGLRPDALATCYAMAENVFAVTQGGVSTPVVVDRVDSQALLTRQYAEPAKEPGNELLLLSAGRPIAGTQLRVIGAQGEDLPERMIGEIAIFSNCMLTGYFHRPDLTEKAFLHGWYLTGDLGYLAGGELYVTGRKKDLIIVGGKNVYPQDLERLAGEVEGVHPGRVVAFGVFNEQNGTEDAVLVAEVDNAQDAASQEAAYRIADEIRRRVNQGSDIALRYVHIVGRNWLLKTSSGKIARLANRDKYLKEVTAG